MRQFSCHESWPGYCSNDDANLMWNEIIGLAKDLSHRICSVEQGAINALTWNELVESATKLENRVSSLEGSTFVPPDIEQRVRRMNQDQYDLQCFASKLQARMDMLENGHAAAPSEAGTSNVASLIQVESKLQEMDMEFRTQVQRVQALPVQCQDVQLAELNSLRDQLLKAKNDMATQSQEQLLLEQKLESLQLDNIKVTNGNANEQMISQAEYYDLQQQLQMSVSLERYNAIVEESRLLIDPKIHESLKHELRIAREELEACPRSLQLVVDPKVHEQLKAELQAARAEIEARGNNKLFIDPNDYATLADELQVARAQIEACANIAQQRGELITERDLLKQKLEQSVMDYDALQLKVSSQVDPQELEAFKQNLVALNKLQQEQEEQLRTSIPLQEFEALKQESKNQTLLYSQVCEDNKVLKERLQKSADLTEALHEDLRHAWANSGENQSGLKVLTMEDTEGFEESTDNLHLSVLGLEEKYEALFLQYQNLQKELLTTRSSVKSPKLEKEPQSKVIPATKSVSKPVQMLAVAQRPTAAHSPSPLSRTSSSRECASSQPGLFMYSSPLNSMPVAGRRPSEDVSSISAAHGIISTVGRGGSFVLQNSSYKASNSSAYGCAPPRRTASPSPSPSPAVQPPLTKGASLRQPLRASPFHQANRQLVSAATMSAPPPRKVSPRKYLS